MLSSQKASLFKGGPLNALLSEIKMQHYETNNIFKNILTLIHTVYIKVYFK